jgi:hypothetical protein
MRSYQKKDKGNKPTKRWDRMNWKDDPYVREWLSKVAERTRKNYTENFPRWLNFISMNPTEQIQRRFKDLQSNNPKRTRLFRG